MSIHQTREPAGDQEGLVVWRRHGIWLGITQASAVVVALALSYKPSSFLMSSLAAAIWVFAISARALRAPDPRLPPFLKRAVFRRRIIWRVATVVFAFAVESLVAGNWAYKQEVQIFHQPSPNEKAMDMWGNLSNLLGIFGIIALAVAIILWIVGLLVDRGDIRANAERRALRQANQQKAQIEAAKKYGRAIPVYQAGYRKRAHASKPRKQTYIPQKRAPVRKGEGTITHKGRVLRAASGRDKQEVELPLAQPEARKPRALAHTSKLSNETNVPQERVSVQIGEGTITYEGRVLRAASGQDRQEIELPLAQPEARKPGLKDPAGPVASIIAFHELYTVESSRSSYSVNLHQVALLDLAGRRVLIWNTDELSHDDHDRLGTLAEAAGIPYDYYDFGDTKSTKPHRHEVHFPLAPGAYQLAPRMIKSMAGAVWFSGVIVLIAGITLMFVGGIGGRHLPLEFAGLVMCACAIVLTNAGWKRLPSGPPEWLK
jgi:hypothetical protein